MNQLWQEMEKEFSKQWEEPSQENNCCVPATVGKFMGMAQSKEKVVQNEVWRNKARSIHKLTYLDYLISEVSEMEAGHLCGMLISTDSF